MGDREFMILGKLVLTFGCLLGLPLWELWKLRRDRLSAAQESEDGKRERSPPGFRQPPHG